MIKAAAAGSAPKLMRLLAKTHKTFSALLYVEEEAVFCQCLLVRSPAAFLYGNSLA
jgi:hypothetical protein